MQETVLACTLVGIEHVCVRFLRSGSAISRIFFDFFFRIFLDFGSIKPTSQRLPLPAILPQGTMSSKGAGFYGPFDISLVSFIHFFILLRFHSVFRSFIPLWSSLSFTSPMTSTFHSQYLPCSKLRLFVAPRIHACVCVWMSWYDLVRFIYTYREICQLKHIHCQCFWIVSSTHLLVVLHLLSPLVSDFRVVEAAAVFSMLHCYFVCVSLGAKCAINRSQTLVSNFD